MNKNEEGGELTRGHMHRVKDVGFWGSGRGVERGKGGKR